MAGTLVGILVVNVADMPVGQMAGTHVVVPGIPVLEVAGTPVVAVAGTPVVEAGTPVVEAAGTSVVEAVGTPVEVAGKVLAVELDSETALEGKPDFLHT